MEDLSAWKKNWLQQSNIWQLVFPSRSFLSTSNLGIPLLVKLWLNEFSHLHMAVPSVDNFKAIAKQYYNVWNFPHRVGSLDGKHIRIKNIAHSGSMYYNYKKFFSIVLQALVDANYKFICVDVGNYGKQSDGGTFRYSSLYQSLTSGTLQLPTPGVVPEGDMELPYVMIADDAYPSLPFLVKPFSGDAPTKVQHNFNKRLSRARRTVEHAFGIIVAKWRLLKKDIETNVDLAVHIVKAICILHNIILDRQGVIHNLTDVTITTRNGRERRPRCTGRPSDQSKEVCKHFCRYFNIHRILWQNNNDHISSEESEGSDFVDDPDNDIN